MSEYVKMINTVLYDVDEIKVERDKDDIHIVHITLYSGKKGPGLKFGTTLTCFASLDDVKPPITVDEKGWV